MGKLASKLSKAKKEFEEPLWKGPCSDDPNGGITQSMLNNFLVCRERFRVKYVLGLDVPDDFNHRLEYGHMWHACEESLAAKDKDPWLKLDALTMELCKKHPLKKPEIFHWYNICKVQFPIYVKYWADHADVVDRTPLMQEYVFCVPYDIPSGSTVYLRGKFDSVDLIDKGIWLQENKTKGDIDPILMQRQLTFDLQTGFYLTALSTGWPFDLLGTNLIDKAYSFGGVRYNVIRRPLSGGQGSIRQKKGTKNVPAESDEEFYVRLGELIESAKGPEWGVLPDEHYFFMRWKVDFTPKDIEIFRRQFLDPILEQLCDWYNWISSTDDPFSSKTCLVGPPQTGPHFRMPYGVYSPILEGRPSDLDEYLETGSTVGLRRSERLFRELDG